MPEEKDRWLCQIERLVRIGRWQWDYLLAECSASPGLCQIYGQPPGWQPTLDDLADRIIEDDRSLVCSAYLNAFASRVPGFSYACRIQSPAGEVHLNNEIFVDYCDQGEPIRVRGISHDISELKHYQERLHEISSHDTLTGLPNRSLFNDRLQRSLTESARNGNTLGLLVLDIDRFKEINDSQGHAIGDRLILETAKRLELLVRQYDMVARLGGDEFAIVLREIRVVQDINRIASKILNAMEAPFSIDGHSLFVSASIGISLFPSDGNSAADLLRCADLALYDAKNRGRACFRFYASELSAKSRERAELEMALRHAEPEDALELYFQPKVALADGRLIGAEALLRWHHPQRGMVPPDQFINIAEESSMIVSIGAWVISKACLAAVRWNREYGMNLRVAINLSPRQFTGDDLLETLRSALSLTGCEPGWLEIEITESLLLDDDDNVRATLRAFHDMGIRIAIDDFGTGYSALGYLKRFPIDVLKIDRSFVNDIMIDADSTELVKAIIHMAHSLRLEIVAEGIETDVQELFLHTYRCQIGQGYRFGKPMPIDAFDDYLATTHPSPTEFAMLRYARAPERQSPGQNLVGHPESRS